MFYSMVEGCTRTPVRRTVSFWRLTLGGCGSSPARMPGFPPRDIRMNGTKSDVSSGLEVVYDLALALLISFFIVMGLMVYFDVY